MTSSLCKEEPIWPSGEGRGLRESLESGGGGFESRGRQFQGRVQTIAQGRRTSARAINSLPSGTFCTGSPCNRCAAHPSAAASVARLPGREATLPSPALRNQLEDNRADALPPGARSKGGQATVHTHQWSHVQPVLACDHSPSDQLLCDHSPTRAPGRQANGRMTTGRTTTSPSPPSSAPPGPRTSSISRDHRQTSRPRAPCVGRLGAPVARREQMFARLRTACKANRRAGQQLHKAGHRAHGATGCVCTMVPKNDRWHEASNRSHTATGTQPDRWACPPVALRASGRRTAGRGERESKGTGRHGTGYGSTCERSPRGATGRTGVVARAPGRTRRHTGRQTCRPKNETTRPTQCTRPAWDLPLSRCKRESLHR